jgi:7-carboxy-7-deazaguanine synthase|tara:strand:+ start:168 stop:1082 length:915 start_codon:yes stop_codon:yes gene_type:complete
MANKKYLYSEIFDSIQGEGQYTGVPTAWLRFFLCNLQCDGFGQDHPTKPETWDLPYQKIDLTELNDDGELKYQKMTDLPVWDKGCDSSYSWAKKFKKLQMMDDAETLADKVRESFKNKWNAGMWLNRHMCFTGGEPMMKTAQQCSMDMMKYWIDQRDYPRSVTYETNGTKEIETSDYINFWQEYRDVWGSELFISCSPKLYTVSGEESKRAIRPDIVNSYQEFAHSGQLKFVVNGTKECWDELEDTIEQFRYAGVNWPVWIMPVGATVEGQELVAADVATEAFKRGFNVSARVHAYIWGNVIGV